LYLARIAALGTSHLSDLEGVSGATGFVWLLLKTLIVLLLVCVLAYVFIRLVLKKLIRPHGGAGASRLTFIERLNVGPRQSIQVVRAGTKVLLIGVNENAIRLLCELPFEEWQAGDTASEGDKERFREELKKWTQKGGDEQASNPNAVVDDLELSEASHDAEEGRP